MTWYDQDSPYHLLSKYHGPYEIIERLSDSCVKIYTGNYVNGEPRYEIQHWENLKPSPIVDAKLKPNLGRKPLNPNATSFQPQARMITDAASPYNTRLRARQISAQNQ